jgi:NAD(P)-dependent dehydrogenase (short-subunit alcohol dehydrogenase family)
MPEELAERPDRRPDWEDFMDLGLKEKTAVITGGSVGIGLAIAEGLAAEGANLILSARGRERLDAEAVRLARGIAPQMKKRGGGVILHNASICAVQPLWYEPIYNVTKAALMMFSKTLSTELVKDKIRVNCINAGLILTPDWIKTAKQLTAETGGDWEGYLQSVADEHASSKRFGTPEELANFFVFLCSDRASYSIGSTYFVDGGMLKTV